MGADSECGQKGLKYQVEVNLYHAWISTHEIDEGAALETYMVNFLMCYSAIILQDIVVFSTGSDNELLDDRLAAAST